MRTSQLTPTELRHCAATQLIGASRTRIPCAPVRELMASAGEGRDTAAHLRFGYDVQRLITRSAITSGRRVVGAKIGLTSEAVQRQLGVDCPDTGVLFEDMRREQDALISIDDLMQPKIEAEIAFVLGHDLDLPDMELPTVTRAIDFAVAALEIVDSLIEGWNIQLVDTVVDNASSGLYVLGDQPRRADADLSSVTMSMLEDGRTVSEGTGAACMGDPRRALLWLARTVRDLGSPLRAGDVILSGALGPMTKVEAGRTYQANISGFGSVCASFM